MNGHSTLPLFDILPIRAGKIIFLRNYFELLLQLQVPDMYQIKINMMKLTYVAITVQYINGFRDPLYQVWETL